MSNDELIKTMLTTVTSGVNEIKDDMKSLDKRIGSLEKLEARDSANLENHMRRTEVNEARVEAVEAKLGEEMQKVKTDIQGMQAALSKDIQSVRTTVIGWKSNIHLMGWILTAGISIATLLLRYIL